MADSFRMASTIFNRFLKLLLGIYLKYLSGYSFFNEQIKSLKPPYIVIANHTNFWDPFLLSMCIQSPVHFVASDAYFRNPVLKFLLKYVGAIPKTKSMTDPQSIRNILTVVKNNGVIGIFAEGRRNWDGTTLPLLYPTAKLVKSLGIPVVSVLFKGACLSMPRWARYSRKGELVMNCSQVLTGSEIKGLSADDIYDRITSSLSHDEYAWQRTKMVPYKGRKKAERLELFLYLCPECKSDLHMKSHNETFYCSNCNYTVKYDEFGFFKPVSGRLYFDNTRAWNIWQIEALKSRLYEKRIQPGIEPILSDENVTAYQGEKTKSLGFLDTGSLYLFCDRIVFKSSKGNNYIFEIADIYGLNVQYNDQLEFYNKNSLFRFGGGCRPISAYKWFKAVEILTDDDNRQHLTNRRYRT